MFGAAQLEQLLERLVPLRGVNCRQAMFGIKTWARLAWFGLAVADDLGKFFFLIVGFFVRLVGLVGEGDVRRRRRLLMPSSSQIAFLLDHWCLFIFPSPWFLVLLK